jgi:D-alanyl-lipoteichoic acid acyltransferase DltB (MBOAT superfamily)
VLFNSYQFIAFFFPVVLAGYYLLGSQRQLRLGWLLVASLAFYAYWDIRFLPLLAGSVLFNWLLSWRLGETNRSALIALGVGFNLALIGLFKYLDFFGGAIYAVLGRDYSPYEWVLPLGISFFTFQQISYLVDRSRHCAPHYPLLEYALYVTFFPQLIAGPIIRHNEIIAQYRKSPLRPDIYHHLGAGAVLFAIGLAKKTLVADRLAETATPLFDLAAGGELLTLGESWSAAIAYSLQLYFDFSGYSDMAIGLGLMFGYQLPVNFNAPYRAADIQDFWRRWHMTLSRFLRDYLYIPLGGNRHGRGRMLLALLVTMLLGGLWHGAGWTFVIWGLLHGLALVAQRIWRAISARSLAPYLSWALLILFLLFSWVVSRADSVTTAWSMWASMVGANGMDLEVRDAPGRWFSLAAFGLAVIGPTSQLFVQRQLKPKPVYAMACALFLFYLTLNVANDGYTEFLYFQF